MILKTSVILMFASFIHLFYCNWKLHDKTWKNSFFYLVETMLAVHLTVEEGLKLKIAMKGGLREKIRGSYVKNIKFPPYYPILSVLFRFTSHFHYFKWKTKMWANSFVMIRNVLIFTLLNLAILHLDILHLHICLCNCSEHIFWSPSIVT